jgi:hypothetical protein
MIRIKQLRSMSAQPRVAQPHRQASSMRPSIFLAFAIFLMGDSMAGPVDDFESAVARWHAASITNYTFSYIDAGADMIAPKCAGAVIRVSVRDGLSGTPVVTKGTSHCPSGTRGRKAIQIDVPPTIEAVFATIRRYLYRPPTPAEITATYDSRYGVPLSYHAVKTEISDSDEGFVIRDFKPGR